MSFDLIIKNGTVVDGTGAPGYAADVAVKDGKIAAIGKMPAAEAKTVIDAKGRIVSPGFIDPHTHYDAQICWDPLLSPSSWHGITTMVMGNCGVGVAPVPPAMREMTMWDLTNVEGIPFELLRDGVTWSEWETFPEYMDAIERRAIGVNVGFIAPLTPFRHAVMGEESVARAANSNEIPKIAALLKEAIEAGAMGFSASKVRSHVGFKGKPLASMNTSLDEFRAYAHILRDLGRGMVELALCKVPGRIQQDEYELLELLLAEGAPHVTYTSIFARDDDPKAHREMLAQIESLSKRGALPQGTPKPLVSYFSLKNPFSFSHFDCVRTLFNQPHQVQRWIYGSPQFRQEFKADLAKPSVAQANWNYYRVLEVTNPSLKPLLGKTIAEIAKEKGKDPVDVFFDIGVEDDLETGYMITLLNGNDDGVAEIVGDPRIMIGLSDGGAHIDALCDASYPTFLLGKWVRERKVMSVERAVQRMTSEPADFFGMKNRGRLAPGKAADIVIFDLATVENAGTPYHLRDFPGGAKRLVVEPRGVDYTIVNGDVLFDHGKDTGARAGQVLRSGRA